MKRPLIVFAGQSNMMGAAVYPATDVFRHKDSFEYKFAPILKGKARGEFTSKSHPCGEFIYTDDARTVAYSEAMLDGDGNSRLNRYSENCCFCPAMANLLSDSDKTTQPFDNFSESRFQVGSTLAPLLVREWETRGNICAYTHITKGGVSISHFFTNEMIAEYECEVEKYCAENGVELDPNSRHTPMCDNAARLFEAKVTAFFRNCEAEFSDDDTAQRVLVWCQGENDALYGDTTVNYALKLKVFRKRLKALGFTHFLFIRIGFWDGIDTRDIMLAQESFCREHDDCFMLTRAMSFMPYGGMDEEKFYISPPPDEYRGCRDSYRGFDNLHVNEKGFELISRHAIDSLCNILSGGECAPEDEIVRF